MNDRVGQQGGAGGSRETLAQQEVPVSVLQIDSNAGVRARRQGGGNIGRQRVSQLVIAEPDVEQVAQHVQRSSLAHWAGEQGLERLDQRGALARQVEVGDEQRRRHRRLSAWTLVGAGRP